MEMLLPFHLSTMLLILLTAPSHLQSVSSTKHNNFTDLESLLDFRTHVDPYDILAANWTTNTSFCSWAGVYCSRHQQRVTGIRLLDLPLQGTISPHLGNLSFLSKLVLSNNSLTGPIPESIGYLRRLKHLILERHNLSGLFPPNIFNMSSLNILSVTDNNLSGSLPSNNSFTMPSRLRLISLGKNRFAGDVLSSFLQCHGIELISLGANQFSGTIPPEVGSLSELAALYLGQNQLTGTIPSSLGNLTKLRGLDLSENHFSGMIPKELGNLASLRSISLAENGNMVGSIPTSLLNISMLNHFDLSSNKLIGSIPDGIGESLPMLEWFDVAENQLSGGLEFLSSLSNCKNLVYLQIYMNKLEGVFPDDVGNLSTNLQHFRAFENHIKGSIPSGLGNLSGLIDIYLDANELSGMIPSTLASLEALQVLSLDFNNISGLLPFEFGQMKVLYELSLRYNRLSGSIPESLVNMSMLQKLRLDNNEYSSSIPENLWTLANLLQLDLSGNSLTGSLSPQVGNLKGLYVLNLSMNMLLGNITSELGKLSMLAILDLSKNSFEGQIPKSLGGLVSVTYLNLSHNSLSGVIPDSLANLSNLDSIDLSFNKLEGQVPKGRAFLNSSISSLIGNEALCGAPQLQIPPCYIDIRSTSRKKLSSLNYILPLTILGMVLLAILCFIYAIYSRRKPRILLDTNAPCLDYHRVISHHELVRATGNFSEANLIGKGGFGSVFRGCLDDGLIVAVKVFNLEVEGSLKSFDAECQVLKMVRHKNLIKIINVCSNLDFKALILEFMPNGSLEQWLYSDNCFLNLIQRLNIMIDVSLALEYLHHHHPQIVLHCDLKPTNILLDEELIPHVSDFGIAKLLGDKRSMTTASMLGTIGYIAPEYAITGAVSRMGDVYSFGIVLLQTFTRKRSVHNEFGETSSLREWVCKAHPHTILDEVDEHILNDHAMKDESSKDLPKLHRCLSSVIELGLLCSRYSPKERIPMTQVAARLQKIKMEYLST